MLLVRERSILTWSDPIFSYPCKNYVANDTPDGSISKIRQKLEEEQTQRDHANKRKKLRNSAIFKKSPSSFEKQDKLVTIIQQWKMYHLYRAFNKWKHVWKANKSIKAEGLSENTATPAQNTTESNTNGADVMIIDAENSADNNKTKISNEKSSRKRAREETEDETKATESEGNKKNKKRKRTDDMNHHQAFLITLNDQLIKQKAVNPILSDASSFVDREGVLNHIEKRMIAPRQQIVRFGHEDEYDKSNEKKWKQEEIQFEKQYELDQFHSERTRKSKRKTAGKGWFDMEAPELTEEMKQELIALRLKHATSGSANQKTRDNRLPERSGSVEDALPQFFQIGTVQEGTHEFYSDRLNKRDRKQSFLDELLRDEEHSGYVSQRYAELQNNLTKEQRNKKKRVEKRFKKNDKIGGGSKNKKQKTK